MSNNRGYINPLMVGMVVTTLLMIVLGATTVMFYGRYTDHRDNVQAKVDEAVASALTEQESELSAQFAEENKRPYETYTAPSAFSGIQVTYPRTWSAYVLEGSGNTDLDGYFHPGFVPDTRSDTRFATRLTLETEAYDEAVADYDRDVERGTIKARAITVNGVKGIRLDGEIDRDISGVLVLLPLRDKTLRVWTESADFIKDFEGVILKEISFNP